MHLEQIDHIALRCASPETTRDWYVKLLGFEHVHPGLWSGSPIMVRLGNTFLTLFHHANGQAPARNGQAWHLALRAATRADFQAAQGELKAAGVSFEFRDHEICHSIYFFDPDNFTVEIVTYDIPK